MCLATKESAKERKKYLKKRGDVFRVYKVVRKDWLGNYRPELNINPYFGRFRAGLNIDTTTRKNISLDRSRNSARYPTGFHAFTTRKGAQEWQLKPGKGTYIIACYVRSSWVHTVGQQKGMKAIVTKKIIMPARRWSEPSQSLLKKALALEAKNSHGRPGGVGQGW